MVITAVIIHLASDGGTNVQPGHAHLNIELISVDNSTQTIKETDNQPLSCGVNPVEYFVTQDLSQPFRYSRALVIESSSPLVVISGIRIRSFRFFDPVALQQCSQADKLYNPRLNTCSNCKCSTPSCQPLKVENGLLKCSGQADGEVCRVSCAPGYQLSGGGAQELETYCLGGNWSKANFLCLPVDCGLPKISFAIVNCQEGTELHRNCSFTCKPPANLIGKKMMNMHSLSSSVRFESA